MVKSDLSILSLERIIKIVLPGVITIAIAKQLGADKYGDLAWVLGIAALLQPINTLGANQLVQVLTKKFKTAPHREEILWAGTKLQLVGSLLSFPIFAGIMVWSENGNTQLMLMIVWLAALLQSGDVAEYWLLGTGQVNNASKPSIFASLTSALFKVIGIVFKASPVYYCFAIAMSALLKTIYLGVQVNLMKLWSKRKINILRKPSRLDLYIGKRSIYFSLNAVSVSIYIQSDIVMLGIMGNKDVVGTYSLICMILAAVTTIASIAPSYIFSRHTLEDRDSIKKFFRITFVSSVIFTLIYIFIAVCVILYLSGGYRDGFASIIILTPMVYMGTMGSALGYHQSMERLESTAIWNTISGAISNILLNLILIPRYSLNGAAMAFTISTFVSTYITPRLNQTSKSDSYKIFINPF